MNLPLFYHINTVASSVTLTYVCTSSQCFVPQKPGADHEQSGFGCFLKWDAELLSVELPCIIHRCILLSAPSLPVSFHLLLNPGFQHKILNHSSCHIFRKCHCGNLTVGLLLVLASAKQYRGDTVNIWGSKCQTSRSCYKEHRTAAGLLYKHWLRWACLLLHKYFLCFILIFIKLFLP